MNTKTIHTVKITNKIEKYTMVNLFSTLDKASIFSHEFHDSLEKEDKQFFDSRWSIDIEVLTVDEL